MSKHPVETKVVAATGSAAGGTVLAAFLVWLLGVTVWGASNDAGNAAAAILAVPAPVSALLVLTVTAVATWGAGYRTHHTARNDDGFMDGSVVWTIVGILAIIALLFWIAPHVR